MKNKTAKLSPANIVDIISRELEAQEWDSKTLMAAAQALGIVTAKERYEDHEFRNARSRLIRKALEFFGSGKAERKPGKRAAWRRTVFELWVAGELDAEKAGDIVRKHAAIVAKRIKNAPSKPRKTFACDGDMSGQYFKLEHETVVSLMKAVNHMTNYSDDSYLAGQPFAGPRINRAVNELIRHAADGVMGFIPEDPLGFRVPFVFEARDETDEERGQRVMLEYLSK
jgi:hypothetical protein